MAEQGRTALRQTHTTLEVAFQHNVTKEQIHHALDEIFKQHGCLACGLGGLDLRLLQERVVSPLPEFRNLPGVASVTSALPR